MIYSPLRYLLSASFILLTWTSCKTATPAPVLPKSDLKTQLTATDKAFIAEFAKKANQTHLIFGCRVYDLSGTKVAGFPGRFCLFEDNGDMLNVQGQYTMSLDPMQKVKWIKNKTFFHHSFKRSLFRDEFLTLASEYLSMKEWPSVRFDELVVMGKNGKILKNFKFSKYDQKKPFPRPPGDDSWSVEKEWGSKEFTHGNSFSETWITKNGKKIQTGYVYYGNTEDHIYLFNTQLKKVTAKIHVPGRRLHAVQQFNNKQLIAYGNAGDQNGPGGIFLIDIKSGAVQELHKFTDKRQGSNSCSSVQILPESLLFIVHSKCGGDLADNTFVEYLDLKIKKSVIQQIGLDYPEISGHMDNLTGFLENNYSH